MIFPQKLPSGTHSVMIRQLAADKKLNPSEYEDQSVRGYMIINKSGSNSDAPDFFFFPESAASNPTFAGKKLTKESEDRGINNIYKTMDELKVMGGEGKTVKIYTDHIGIVDTVI